MTLATAASYAPVVQTEYLDRLAALAPDLGAGPEFWTYVHDEIQRLLTPLETDVRRRVSGVCMEHGRTHGSEFFLFSYCTFSLPESDVDPVVVGMTFTPSHGAVKVEADVSGERTGDWISSLPSKTVANSAEEVMEAARDLSQLLCRSTDAIADALTDPSRIAE